jgi:hypothetical protein
MSDESIHSACGLVRHQHRLNLGEQGATFGKCESQAGNAGGIHIRLCKKQKILSSPTLGV